MVDLKEGIALSRLLCINQSSCRTRYIHEPGQLHKRITDMKIRLPATWLILVLPCSSSTSHCFRCLPCRALISILYLSRACGVIRDRTNQKCSLLVCSCTVRRIQQRQWHYRRRRRALTRASINSVSYTHWSDIRAYYVRLSFNHIFSRYAATGSAWNWSGGSEENGRRWLDTSTTGGNAQSAASLLRQDR